MKRRLSFLEGSMYAGPDTPANVVMSVHIKGNISADNLINATRKVQRRHPFLNVRVIQDAKGIPWYESAQEIMPIPLRIVERRAERDWENEAEVEWKTLFDMETGPLARLVWLRSDTVSDLILVCHHCICDATSVLCVMNEILELTDRPNTEITPYKSFSSVHELIPAEVLNSKRNIFTAKLIAGVMRVFLGAVGWMKEIKKDHFYVIRWKLSLEQTALILKKCKQEDISVNTALCLAFLKAFENVLGLNRNLKIFSSVDMRRFLPEIGKNQLFAFPAMIDLSYRRKKGVDFWEQAKVLRDKLYAQIAKTDAGKMLMFTEYLVPLLPKSIRYAKAGKGPHDFTFSNLGRINIQEAYDTFRISQVHSPFSLFPMGNPTKVITSTFRQQIDFIFTSEKGFLSYKDAVAIKEKAMQILLTQVSNKETSLF